jgi:hypothetical protein
VRHLIYLFSFFLLLGAGCNRDVAITKKYQASKVVLIVIDGVRFTDINTDSALLNLPDWKSLLTKGNLHEAIYNDGVTNTVNGLTSLSTGKYAQLQNNGSEIPKEKTFFHYYLEATKLPFTKAAIFSSKDKIGILKNAGNGLMPYTDCGIMGSGYRKDSLTLHLAKKFVLVNTPNLLLVHFSEPDISGHTGNFVNYKNAIRTTTLNVKDLYEFLESLPVYNNQTKYFITNDHGRHTIDFANHGDGCDGCRHCTLLTIGPDIKKGRSIETASQVDIPATISEVLNLENFTGSGKVIAEVIQ